MSLIPTLHYFSPRPNFVARFFAELLELTIKTEEVALVIEWGGLRILFFESTSLQTKNFLEWQIETEEELRELARKSAFVAYKHSHEVTPLWGESAGHLFFDVTDPDGASWRFSTVKRGGAQDGA
jgi:hypothetical protein